MYKTSLKILSNISKKMGATLGRLYVYDYNLTTFQFYNSYDSIDFAASNPILKANVTTMPFEKLLEKTGWKSDHLIVRTVMIGAINGSVYGSPGPYPMKQSKTYIFCKSKLPREDELEKNMTNEDKEMVGKLTEDEKKQFIGIKDEKVELNFKLEYGSSIADYKLNIFDATYKYKNYKFDKYENVNDKNVEE